MTRYGRRRRQLLRTQQQLDLTATALNVALAWLDGRATGTDRERDAELAGCREALRQARASA